MIIELNDVSFGEIGYIKKEEPHILNILYPIDYSEMEILKLINKLMMLFQNAQNLLTTIIIKNQEISVRLFLFLIELVDKYNIELYLPETIYNHFKIKKDKVLNLTKINTDLIKVYNE